MPVSLFKTALSGFLGAHLGRTAERTPSKVIVPALAGHAPSGVGSRKRADLP
jgi:hypothetical protein